MRSHSVELVVTGDLVLDGQVVPDAAVAVQDGRIVGLSSREAAPPAAETIDGRGLWILPGFLDAHVHAASTPTEGFAPMTAAAAAGGVTTVIDHPVDSPRGTATVPDLRTKVRAVESQALVDVALLGLVKATTLDEIPGLVQEGVCGFKLSLFDTDPDRFPLIPDPELYEAFRRIARLGSRAGVHAENDAVIRALTKRYRAEGRTYPRAHCETRPEATEVEASLRAMEFARAAGVHLHIYHVTLARIIDLADYYRSGGLSVSTETCPHYLLLAEEDMDRLKAFGKINPPLRPAGEGERLWRLLADGKIDQVTSDHSPWPEERKRRPDIFENASGCPGVQTLMPLVYSYGVVAGRITLRRFVEILSANPARIFHLAPRKGTLRPGADADLVLFDPKREGIISREGMRSTAKWSPFEGMRITGEVRCTLVRGRVVYRDGEILGKPGDGHFVRPAAEGEGR